MLIDGLNGGSTDKLHKGWFEITGFDFDLMTIVNIGSAKRRRQHRQTEFLVR